MATNSDLKLRLVIDGVTESVNGVKAVAVAVDGLAGGASRGADTTDKLSAKIDAMASGAAGAANGVKAAVVAVDGLASGADRGADATEKLSSKIGAMAHGLIAFQTLKQLAGAVMSLGEEMLQAKIRAESLETGLRFAIAGSTAGELAYLRGITNQLGLEFQSTAVAYMKFAASARETALEGDGARKVFESVAKASTVMGLSAEENQGVLLALSQMISKGTVSAEELRGQLGERMPGAFQIAARAMGVTTEQLGKMLEQGQLLSEDFLPKFADQLNRELGDAALQAGERTEAAINRMGNAWELLKQTLADSGVTNFLKGQLNILTDAMDDVSKSMLRAKGEGDGFMGQMLAAAGAAARFINPLNAVSYSAQDTGAKLRAAEAELAKLQTRWDNHDWHMGLADGIKDAQALVDKLKANVAAQQSVTNFRDLDKQSMAAYGRLQKQEADAQKKQQADLVEIKTKLSGVDSGYLTTLGKLQSLRAAGAIGEKEYIDLVSELATKTSKSSDATKGFTAAKAAAKQASEAAAKQSKEESDLLLTLSGVTKDHGKNVADLNAMYARHDITKETYLRLMDEELAKQPIVKDGLKADEEARKAVAKAMDEVNKQYDAEVKAAEKSAESAVDRLKKLQDEEAAIALSKDAHVSLAEAMERLALKRLDDLALVARENGNQETLDAIGKEITARQGLIVALNSKDARDANATAATAAADEWKKTADSIYNGLTDSLYRSFESGKDFFATFWAGIKNTFKTTVLKLGIQAVMSASGLSGLLGASNAAAGTSGATGAGGGIGGWAGALSALKSGAAWITDFGGSVTNLAASAGGSLYNAGFQTAGNALGSNAAAIGDYASMAGNGLGYASSLYSLANGQYGAAAGSAIGTYFGGPIGATIGNVIGSFVDKLFSGGAGTPHRGAGYISDGTTASDVRAGAKGLEWAAGGSVNSDHSQGIADALKTLTGGSASMLNDVAKAFGAKAGYSVGGYFASDNNDKSKQQRTIYRDGAILSTYKAQDLNKDATKGLEQFTTQLADQVRATMATIDMPAWAKKQIDALGTATTMDALAATVASITQTESALKSLGESFAPLGGVFGRVAGLSSDATMQLVEFSGGLSALIEKTQAYVSAYYTDAEKMAISAASIKTDLAAAGITANISSRADLRALVDATDVGTETGRQQLAALLDVSAAFAPVADYLQEQGQTLADLAAAAPQVALLEQAQSQTEIAQQTVDGIQALTDGVAAIGTQITGAITVMQGVVEAALVAVATSSAETARQLKAWDNGGALVTTPDGP